jgi:lipoprotein-releasing system permease protein
MYRLLLCCRYLRTRHVALASVISVILGVATMVVVNSVMAGFAEEMQSRLHGLVSDIVIERHSGGGIPNPDLHLEEILRVCGDDVIAHTASVHVPAMLNIDADGQLITRHVSLVGLDPRSYNGVSDFGQYLLHPQNRDQFDFKLRNSGFAPERLGIRKAGWEYRRQRMAARAAREAQLADKPRDNQTHASTSMDSAAAGPAIGFVVPRELYRTATDRESDPTRRAAFDPFVDQYPGIVLGIATCSNPITTTAGGGTDHYYCLPGDDVKMTFPNASEKAKAVSQKFTVVDIYESGMREHDGAFAFCRLDQLQEFRGMIDPATGVRSVTSIQLKLAPGADLYAVRDALRDRFPIHEFGYSIQTWRELQGPMVEMVRMQTMLLNTLLFLIITVAGFGILATFFMIVVEKTRDIGTLKALGASNRGVMSIFLGYGLLLGFVGSGVGLLSGLVFVHYINQIAGVLEQISGQPVFDPAVYYFAEIPTAVQPFTLLWVMGGAILIATLASVLPALRAARMNPVQALRFA